MNIIFSLLPIIFIILIVGFVVLIVHLLTKWNLGKKKKYLLGQKIRWIFGIYVGILLLSVGVFFLIPTEGNSSIDHKKVKNGLNLYDTALNGSVNDIDNRFISKTWDFPYENDTLDIVASENDVNGISIFVEKRSNKENHIDVTFYQTPAYVEDVDVTNQIKPPYIELPSDTLRIAKPPQQELNFTAFKQPFPVIQFIGDDWMGMSNSFVRGDQLLYISVPKDLKIHQDHHTGVEYIQK